MSIGSSGRLVIEVDPEAKRLLYAALARDGMTLKEWFLKSAERYLADGRQLPLSFAEVIVTEKAERAQPDSFGEAE